MPIPSARGKCFVFDTWEISRQVFLEHFTSFGFDCKSVDTFDELCHLSGTTVVAVAEVDEDIKEIKSKFKEVNAKFKVAVCRLRSPNEVRTEPSIDAMVSRHIKRDSLRNIIDQLLKSGTVVQETTRHIPYMLY
jgi:hypothetical protein